MPGDGTKSSSDQGEWTMQKQYLMTPGPTPVPAEVMLKMAAPIIHHRTPDFSAAFKAAIELSLIHI